MGSGIVATRFVVEQAGPASLALLRYLVGLSCLMPPALASARGLRLPARDLLPIALLGVLQFGVLIALLNHALRFIPSARAALIFATMPFLTMLLAAALGHERLAPRRALGVLATVAGVGLALGEKALQRGDSAGAWSGELATLASAGIGAVCSVLYGPYLRRHPPLPASAVAMLAAVVFLAGLAAAEGFFGARPRFTGAGWLAVAYIGVSSGLGYYLWLWALRHAPPTEVTAYLALSPVTATILGAWLLDEPLSATSGFAVLGVALGLWLAGRPAGPPARPRRPA